MSLGWLVPMRWRRGILWRSWLSRMRSAYELLGHRGGQVGAVVAADQVQHHVHRCDAGRRRYSDSRSISNSSCEITSSGWRSRIPAKFSQWMVAAVTRQKPGLGQNIAAGAQRPQDDLPVGEFFLAREESSGRTVCVRPCRRRTKYRGGLQIMLDGTNPPGCGSRCLGRHRFSVGAKRTPGVQFPIAQLVGHYAVGRLLKNKPAR